MFTSPNGFFVETDSSTTSILYFYKKRKKNKNNSVLKHAKTVCAKKQKRCLCIQEHKISETI